uniref:NADH dehydrogenase subunit 6 n=1 Tax=Phascolosoma esculenta TaxID=419950 RepID=C3PUI3_9ANNE|nr:NADH dehydrogenase subunit 6 [Phascolosoma esculenta]ABQ52599.1 NADH dehydrogenase subunit 6 [Phascolosoma esculenta]AWK60894.1 NADH dehydrogenase subunit 6 [Phascolosoma esculenta]
MFLSILMACSFSLFFSLPLTASPLTLGVWVLLLSMMSASILSLCYSSWMAMILILVYIGGLNVLFAYFVATLPNHHLFFKPLSSSFIIILTSLLLNFQFFPASISFNSQQVTFITKMLFNENSFIFLLLAFILFLALIAVVKIASRHNGPLRPFIFN